MERVKANLTEKVRLHLRNKLTITIQELKGYRTQIPPRRKLLCMFAASYAYSITFMACLTLLTSFASVITTLYYNGPLVFWKHPFLFTTNFELMDFTLLFKMSLCVTFGLIFISISWTKSKNKHRENRLSQYFFKIFHFNPFVISFLAPALHVLLITLISPSSSRIITFAIITFSLFLSSLMAWAAYSLMDNQKPHTP